MSNISEGEWREAMTKIFEKLEDDQYRKMKGLLNELGYASTPRMTAKFKRELPKTLLQKFGVEESIRLVSEAMKEIPRNDPGVQDLLRPFMDKLRKQETGPETSSQPKKLSNISEDEWRDAMTKIFEKLDIEQYKRLVQLYDDQYIFALPKITAKFKSDLPKKFIQKYGVEESIRLINSVMNALQRNDSGVQNLLRPFVDKLKRQEKQKCENSGWMNALAHIVDELRGKQYQKMLEYLVKIPESEKGGTPREEMNQTIIEHYGEDGSIAEIRRIMDLIPRRDPAVQNLLRPFVVQQERRAAGAISERRAAGAAGGETVQNPGRPSKRKRLPSPSPEFIQLLASRNKFGYKSTEPLQVPEASSAGIRSRDQIPSDDSDHSDDLIMVSSLI